MRLFLRSYSMSEAIIVGLLSLAGTVLGAYFANRKSSAVIVYRIDELEKKVDKHNSVIERTYKLEQRVDDLEKAIE